MWKVLHLFQNARDLLHVLTKIDGPVRRNPSLCSESPAEYFFSDESNLLLIRYENPIPLKSVRAEYSRISETTGRADHLTKPANCRSTHYFLCHKSAWSRGGRFCIYI